MSGARYVDWSHIHVVGDRDVAAKHVPYARKLLGFAMDEAQRNQLGVAQIERTLDDGTKIIAEKHGSIPRVTIIPVHAREEPQQPRFGDFVVWPRNEALPTGIDAEHPQQILRYANGAWRTFFYSSSTAGHDAYDGPKGSYIGALPEGVTRAGNVDWVGPRRERLQWHGPSTRYWYDPFVQMWAQYDRKVYMLGQVVLDTDQYITDSDGPAFDERYVLGAGMRGLWLYVVQAQAQNLSVPVPDPAAVVAPNQVYYLFSVGYTPFGVSTAICRYRLIPHPDGTPGRRVVPNSREVLWSGEIDRGVSPWFVNSDCTEAVTFVPPETQAYGSSTFVTSFDSSTLQKRLVLEHDEDDSSVPPAATMSDVPVSLAPGGGEAPIAVDWKHDGTRVEVRIRRRDLNLGLGQGRLSQRFDIIVGDAPPVELRALEPVESTEHFYDTRRWIMWADAREDTLVCRRQLVQFRDPPGSDPPFVSMQVWLEIWNAGGRMLERTDGRTDVNDDNNSFGTWIAYSSNIEDRQSDNVDAALAPLLPIYGWCWGQGGVLNSVPHQICGHHAGFCYLPRQPAAMFGWALSGRITSSGVDIPETYNVYAARVNAPPEAQKLDLDSMDSVLGAAVLDGVLVLSAYPKGAGLKAADHVVLSPPGTQLPALTGVAAPLERYHPVWLLGELPNAA